MGGRVERGKCARTTALCFGYDEVVTPVLEHPPVFLRSLGVESDVVGKEMYTFTDRSKTQLSLSVLSFSLSLSLSLFLSLSLSLISIIPHRSHAHT